MLNSQEEMLVVEEDIPTDINDDVLEDIFDDTEVAGDPLTCYLRDISKSSLLSPEEERELFSRYQDPSVSDEEKQDIRDEIVTRNLRLCVHVAKKYARKHPYLDFMDMIQEGNIGLMRAIETFRLDVGTKFSTYAYLWISQHINRWITNTEYTIRIPVHMMEALNKYYAALSAYAMEHNGERPSFDELIELTGLSAEKLDSLIAADLLKNTTSLYVPVGAEDGRSDTELIEILEDPRSIEQIDTELMREDFKNAIVSLLDSSKLSQRYKDIFYLRTGLLDGKYKTLDDVAKVYGITRERVRQIEAKVYRYLRSPRNKSILSAYRNSSL